MTPETEARVLRDAIYGPQKDPNNWPACREAWVRDLEWLRAEYRRLKSAIGNRQS